MTPSKKILLKPNVVLAHPEVFPHAFMNRSSRYLHVKGCPLSVGQHVNYLSSLGKISNPNLDPKLAIQANISYYQMRFHRFASRFLE